MTTPTYTAAALPVLYAIETARLEQASKTPCPGCGNVMSVGDEEHSGMCMNCYATAMQDEQDRRSGEPL